MDETGFQIGVRKNQLVITKRRRARYLGIPTNRESATAIEAISTSGQYTPAFLILSGLVHLARWYKVPELYDDTAICVSATGYSNDQLSLEWIEYFHQHLKNKARGAKRLLLLDGYGSHHTREFIRFCDNNGIIPFGLPPHTTHYLQPLDVVVFQPLKHYHAKAVDIVVREGCTNITKLEFLSFIQEVRRQAFKTETILSAFKKTGIQPFNPRVVLDRIAERAVTPEPAPYAGSSPFGTP